MSRDNGPEACSAASRRIETTPVSPAGESFEPHVALHLRTSRIVMAAIVIFQLAFTGSLLFSSPQSLAATPRTVDQAQNITVEAQPDPSLDPLTSQEQQASQIAAQNGDRNYLMVDKPRGKIALFENGTVVFSGAALTGESKADRLPPGKLSKKFSQLGALDDKVTPAGRFTVSRDYDREYGALFDINEIQGRDWTISIHQVYLGTPSERRADRLQSPDHQDKHITHGCINVTRETIRLLMGKLPKKPPTVLYVLPHDQSKTAEYLARRS